MKTKLISAILLCLASLPVSAWNVDESNKTVVAVGSHKPTLGFVAFTEGIHASCGGGLYFDIATPLGKSMLATLLVAKTTNQKVRVAYTTPATTGLCYLELALLM